MKTIQFNINAKDINLSVLNAIQAYYGTKDIEITVKEASSNQTAISMFNQTPDILPVSQVQKYTISLEEQLELLVQFIQSYKIKKICYLGDGRQEIIQPIASKNIEVNVTSGRIASIISHNFWCDVDEEPLEFPEWAKDLPIYSQIEGIPDEPLYLIDSLGTENNPNQYIRVILDKSNPKVIVLLNSLDLRGFQCYQAYTWLEQNGLTIGLLNSENKSRERKDTLAYTMNIYLKSNELNPRNNGNVIYSTFDAEKNFFWLDIPVDNRLNETYYFILENPNTKTIFYFKLPPFTLKESLFGKKGVRQLDCQITENNSRFVDIRSGGTNFDFTSFLIRKVEY